MLLEKLSRWGQYSGPEKKKKQAVFRSPRENEKKMIK
jgi:hypothetical protein